MPRDAYPDKIVVEEDEQVIHIQNSKKIKIYISSCQNIDLFVQGSDEINIKVDDSDNVRADFSRCSGHLRYEQNEKIRDYSNIINHYPTLDVKEVIHADMKCCERLRGKGSDIDE